VVGAAADTPFAVDFPDVTSVDPLAIAEDIETVADLAGSVRYKRQMVATYVRRALVAFDTRSSNEVDDDV
jgi:hypothetical protein